jgi:hypothetical protein
MTANELWIGLAVGLVPYRIQRRWGPRGQRTLDVRALFWSLTVHRRRSGRLDWTLRVPIIERLRDAAWAAAQRLRGGPSPHR